MYLLKTNRKQKDHYPQRGDVHPGNPVHPAWHHALGHPNKASPPRPKPKILNGTAVSAWWLDDFDSPIFQRNLSYWILLGIAILFCNIWATFLKIYGRHFHSEYLKQVLDFRICPIFTMSPNGNSGFIGTDVNSALGSCSLWVAYPTLYGWSVIPGSFLKHHQFFVPKKMIKL